MALNAKKTNVEIQWSTKRWNTKLLMIGKITLPSAFLVSKPTKKISVLKFNPYLVSGMEDLIQRLTPATL